MNIEFELTLEDMIEFNLFMVDNSPSLRRQLAQQRVILALIIFVSILIIAYTTRNHLTVFDYIISLVVSILDYVIHPQINRFSSIRRLKKFYSEAGNKAILGKQQIVVSQDGLMGISQVGESKINWSSINKIVKNEKYIFLHIGPANAITIPRSSFGNRKMEDEFLKIVHENTGK